MPDKRPNPSEPSSEERIEVHIKDKPNAVPSKKIKLTENESPDANSAKLDHKSKTAPELPEGLLKTLKLDNKVSQTAAPAPKVTIKTPSEQPTTQALIETSLIEDNQIDKAVDDIVAKESDMLLAIDDAVVAKRNKVPKPGWKAKLRSALSNKWLWLTLLALIIILSVVPFTRYKLIGLVYKRPVSVEIIDSKTNAPVSDALVSLDGYSTRTDASGKAKLKSGPGQQSLKVTKQYYMSKAKSYFVKLSGTNSSSVYLVATGRLVPVAVFNSISGQPVAGVSIKVLNTTAKTNNRGLVTIALPAANASDTAIISASGYNKTAVNLEVTNNVVAANNFKLTPTGKIYFLSNLNGTIDVEESNLDGSDVATVLAGTGQENPSATSLIASRDWRYLVLEADRSGNNQNDLYLIDTSDNKVTEFEDSNANISPIGWSGHYFIYDQINNADQQSQSGREVIESYDADNQQLNQLDQNLASGTATSYGYQAFSNFNIVSNELVYTTMWYSSYNSGSTQYDLSSQTDSIRGVEPNGQDKKDYQTFSASATNSIQAVLYQPQSIYYALSINSKNTTQYYNYNDQSVSQTNIDQTTFAQAYPTYLASPSGSQTLWSEPLGDQNNLLIGNAEAQGEKQVMGLSSYKPYGWYGDSYILVSKDNSELYIMPASGLKANQQPLKIANYYNSNHVYAYGGL